MKNIKLIIASVIATTLLSACVAKNSDNEVIGIKGLVSGATYKPDIVEDIYEVTSAGVVFFMTEEQIQKAKLNNIDTVIKYAYSITKLGNQVQREDANLK